MSGHVTHVRTHSGILCSHKKGRGTDTYNEVDEHRKYAVEWVTEAKHKRPPIALSLWHDTDRLGKSINSWLQVTRDGTKGEQEATSKCVHGILWGDENVVTPDREMVAQQCGHSKHYWTVQFRMANCMYVNFTSIKNETKTQTTSL